MTLRRLLFRGLVPLSVFAVLATLIVAHGISRATDDQSSQGTPAVVRDQAVPVMPQAEREPAPARKSDDDHVAEERDVHGEVADTVVAQLPPTKLKTFSLLGVTWREGLVDADTAVEVRWRDDNGWSDWTELHVDPADEGNPGTEPYWVGSADAAAVRVLSTSGASPQGLTLATIDPGSMPTLTPAASIRSAVGGVAQPTIISRSAWGASNSGSCDSPVYGSALRGAVIHHTAGSNTEPQSRSAAVVKATQAYHMNSRDWCDIGYNFLVDRFGQIFEGRRGGIDKVVRGAHAGNGPVNEETTGISLMGTFTSTDPTAAMKDAVVRVTAWKFALHGVQATGTYALGGETLNRISGHRNVVSTECPGTKVYDWLVSTSSSGLRQQVKSVLDSGAAEPSKPPTGVEVTGQSVSGLDVDWASVSGAERYIVKLSTSSSWTNPLYERFTESNGTVSGLKAGTKYYVKVALADLASGTRISDYSAKPYATASTSAIKPPTNVTAIKGSSTSLDVDWASVSGAERYIVKLSTSSSWTNPLYERFTESNGTVSGLKAGTKYYVKVALADLASGTRISDYSAKPYATASTGDSSSSSKTGSTASDKVTVPSSRSIAVDGHGYGHGIGMSQYGAEGGARDGEKYGAILSHYYPGTALATKSGNIRVLISGDTTDSVLVEGETGLKLEDMAGDRTISLPTTVGGKSVIRWRIIRTEGSATRSKLQYRTGDTYTTYVYKGAGLAWGGDGQFIGPTTIGLVMPSGSTLNLRGAVRSAKPSSGSGARNTVNVLSIEDYTRGVVAREMPSSWHAEALKAQSVAARTYGAKALTSSRYYDICDTTSCQVYGGVSAEASTTDAAIKATEGKILTYQGVPAFTQFSSSSGGYSNVGSQPYLKAVNDPWDDWTGNKNHSWTISVAASKIEKEFPTIGTLKSMEVTKRNGKGDMGGRVTSLKLIGSKASKTITGVDARWALGLKSDWFGF